MESRSLHTNPVRVDGVVAMKFRPEVARKIRLEMIDPAISYRVKDLARREIR
jgi:hypothetical protein